MPPSFPILSFFFTYSCFYSIVNFFGPWAPHIVLSSLLISHFVVSFLIILHPLLSSSPVKPFESAGPLFASFLRISFCHFLAPELLITDMFLNYLRYIFHNWCCLTNAPVKSWLVRMLYKLLIASRHFAVFISYKEFVSECFVYKETQIWLLSSNSQATARRSPSKVSRD